MATDIDVTLPDSDSIIWTKWSDFITCKMWNEVVVVGSKQGFSTLVQNVLHTEEQSMQKWVKVQWEGSAWHHIELHSTHSDTDLNQYKQSILEKKIMEDKNKEDNL